ncbi:MAG: hypothetical protein AAGA54_28890 [Myxococcota bacterium]
MNERSVVIIALLGAGFVAYAVYGLLSRSMEPGSNGPAPVKVDRQAEAEDQPAPTPAVRRAAEGTQRPLPKPRVNPPVGKGAPAGPAPAVPMPDVSLEEARESYDDLVAEIEREIQRNKDTGKPLATEHWAEYYQRSHDVMNPLRRHLGFEDDAARDEVAEKDETLRDLLDALQADPKTLEAPDEAAE